MKIVFHLIVPSSILDTCQNTIYAIYCFAAKLPTNAYPLYPAIACPKSSWYMFLCNSKALVCKNTYLIKTFMILSNNCLIQIKASMTTNLIELNCSFILFVQNLLMDKVTHLDIADCCSLPSWLASQGSARHPVQGGYSHTFASTPVTRARMLCCSCPRAPTHSSGN